MGFPWDFYGKSGISMENDLNQVGFSWIFGCFVGNIAVLYGCILGKGDSSRCLMTLKLGRLSWA